MRVFQAVLILLITLPLLACSPAARSPDGASTVESRSSLAAEFSLDPEATLQPPLPAAPTLAVMTQLPAIGQRIAFESEDGTPLMGEYFPATRRQAPVVILMHQMSSNRRVWVRKGVVDWLNNAPKDGLLTATQTASALKWPALPREVSFAVFIFDFRGHGESQGGKKESADLLMDARAAIAVVRGLAGVDPERIALIGASTGADAAAAVCAEGCLGALSISPSDRLGGSYQQSVAALGRAGKPAWCLAAAEDRRSARTCAEAEGSGYFRLVYSGQSAHGFDLIAPGFDPEITHVFRNFVFKVFGL